MIVVTLYLSFTLSELLIAITAMIMKCIFTLPVKCLSLIFYFNTNFIKNIVSEDGRFLTPSVGLLGTCQIDI